ncbi:MAG: hypothetical protein JKY23_04350 [Nitrospinaceae bacterium]|nr:hypothetical protein [Nitrospinaceae bacterium]
MDKPTFHHHLAVIRDMMANASTAPDDALSPEELVERWKLKKRVLDYAFATGIEQSLQRAVAEASAGTQDKDM